MSSAIQIKNLNKVYKDGFQALKNINLDIKPGEIFALLGPNGAGKTTLISCVCGIVQPTSGQITVGSYDIARDYRTTRSLIGLVPQELTTEAFETVWNTVSLSRGLFGKAPNPHHIESVLKSLSLWDKRNKKIMTLSGGMKRRVLIAKALSHEPQVLFLDEPTAGVDVELRKGMWELVHNLRSTGVTIILTTHYIEEAEEMADRVGVINRGELILVEEKSQLMKKMGMKKILLELDSFNRDLPASLQKFNIEYQKENQTLCLSYHTQNQKSEVFDFFEVLKAENIRFRDLTTKQSSLEEIFVNLVRR